MALVLPSPENEHFVTKNAIEMRNRDLQVIKEWLRKQPHLPQNLEDRFLLNFLRGCKFSMEKFKKKLDMYFTVRRHVPEFFTNRDVSRPELRELLSYAYAITLPTLTPEGRIVHLGGVTTTDFETPDFSLFCKIISMMRDLRLQHEETPTTGDIYILNASVAVPKHFFRLSPVVLKKFLICSLKAYPTVVKEVHVVNLHYFVDSVVRFIKPLVKEKLMNRVHFHSTLASLHQHVPKDMLPEEYGGTAGKLDDYREKTIKYLEKHAAWFKQQEQVVADESKRFGKQQCTEDLFGLDGSFRQLNID